MFDAELLTKNIKKYRNLKMVSQTEVAEHLKISPQSVSKWECGISVPDINNLCALAEYFNISLETLVGVSENSRKVMIGVDGGGTKTEFVMFDGEGNVLGRTLHSGCNPNVVGFDECLAVLKKGISELVRINPNLCGIYIGAAGFLLSDKGKEIRERLSEIYPNVKIRCKSDMANVAASCTVSENCIGAVCGTGYVAYAKIGEELIRYGGWGYMLGRYGSGYDLGRDAVTSALSDKEGRGEKTKLTALIENASGKSIDMLIGDIHKNGSAYLASFAPLVFDAYEMGDEAAKKILKENAYAVAEELNHISGKYNITKDVVLSGSLISSNDVYIGLIKEKLNPDISCVVPKLPQIFGACRLCAAMCRITCDEFEENFINGYSLYEN